MKILITESLDTNLLRSLPRKIKNDYELVDFILSDTFDGETEFGILCRSAEFIFDRVEYFRPLEALDPNASHIVRELRRVKTSIDGVPKTKDQWLNDAIEVLGTQYSEGQIQGVLSSCLPNELAMSDCAILSPDPFVTAIQVKGGKKLNKESLLYMLATAGIAIAVPPIVASNDNEIHGLKEQFAEERIDYLLFLHKFLDEILSECSSSAPNVEQIMDFANNKFALELRLKSKKISEIAKKKGKGVTQAIKVEFLNQAPVICTSILKGKLVDVGGAVFKILLSAANGEKDFQMALADYKEAAYIFRLADLGS